MESTTIKSTELEIAEIELVYRPKFKVSSRPAIRSSLEFYEFIRSTWNMDQIQLREHFKVVLLNRANIILGILELSSGGIGGTVVDPRLIFAAALKANASGIFLTHNHPSGSLKPSHSDIQLTQKIKEIGELHEIRLLDHLIISNEGYFSFADEGLL